MIDHPRKIAARLSHSPKMAARETGYAVTINEVRAICDLQIARSKMRNFTDPLILAARDRHYRKASAVAARAAVCAAQEAAENEKRLARIAAEQSDRDRRNGAEKARETLLRAARVARSMGCTVRSSKDRAGRISSYYIRLKNGGPQVRISDHAIPPTTIRESRAAMNGQDYSGYSGPELIIAGDRPALWLRRALALLLAGRDVPGA